MAGQARIICVMEEEEVFSRAASSSPPSPPSSSTASLTSIAPRTRRKLLHFLLSPQASPPPPHPNHILSPTPTMMDLRGAGGRSTLPREKRDPSFPSTVVNAIRSLLGCSDHHWPWDITVHALSRAHISSLSDFLSPLFLTVPPCDKSGSYLT